jgi:hypothetical protein
MVGAGARRKNSAVVKNLLKYTKKPPEKRNSLSVNPDGYFKLEPKRA